MPIDQYYTEANNQITFTRQQASDFAKLVADDFNPLHNVDAKRFCVPGDLLFAIILTRYGVTNDMRFSFSGMVTEDVALTLPTAAPRLSFAGNNGKEYVSIELLGQHCRNDQFINALTSSYVTFSGHTFPHILIPLMQEKNVMINPERPMVMYQSMLIDLERMDTTSVELELDRARTVLEVDGKRGNVCLAFNLISAGEIIGRGEKHMVVSGLRTFEQAVVDQVITDYDQIRKNHKMIASA